MRKVLLVEDEPLELIALRGNVRRIYGDSLDILEAEDGTDALALCEKQNPDIVLADINIPGISGLELIQILSESGFTGKILIITAYDTSDYIRQALSLGVIGYLLKPVRTEELEKEMEKCFALLKRDQELRKNEIRRTAVSSYAEQYLVRDLLRGQFPGEILRDAYGWPQDQELSACVIVCQEHEQDAGSLPEQTQLQQFFLVLQGRQDGCRFLFLQSRETLPREQILVNVQACAMELSRHESAGCVMAVSDVAVSYEQLKDTAFRLRQSLCEKENGLYFQTMAADIFFDAAEQNKMTKRWQQRLREGQAEAFTRMLRRKAAAPGSYWAVISILLLTWDAFDDSVPLVPLAEMFGTQRPFSAFEKWLGNYYQCHAMTVQAGGDRGKIQYAVAWLKEHFQEDISRNALAEKLGLSETYFSSLFKQETGESFVQMLNEIRIHHALELIEEGETDMNRIAASCGYYSRKYFLEVFKRVVGCPVTDYEKHVQKGKLKGEPDRHSDLLPAKEKEDRKDE